ncbi:MAG: peptidylprolyl isomerase [Deltaproteobacteria bacterium]
MRIQIARAEVKRAGGVEELGKLVASGTATPTTRALALRGLGRIGGDAALAVVRTHLGDADPGVSAAAFAAIGVAAALDDTAPLSDEVELPAGMKPEQAVVVLEAFGRAGAIADQSAIITAAAHQPASVVAAAALALGRMGRRKLAYQNATRDWLVERASDRSSEVRYAAAYALSREHQPIAHAGVVAALAKLVTDDDPETRATAIAGLAKRDIATARAAISESLRDRDWRVAVEAVRALAGDKGDPAGRDLVATNLERRWTELQQGHGSEAQVLAESLRQIIAHPELTPTGAAVLAAFATHIAPAISSPQVSPLARTWITELAAVANAEVAHQLTPDLFSRGELPDYLRVALAADAYPHGDATFQRVVLRMMLEHVDARVRAAGLGVLPVVAAPDRPLAVTTLAAALASPDPIIAGAASDAAGELYAKLGDDTALRGQLDGAIVQRAAREQDPELGSGLYDLIAKHAIASGVEACRAGLHGVPVRARSAAKCLEALGQAVPAPAIGDEIAPPGIDVASVIGKHLAWHVVTSSGEIVIILRPDIAPWNVATIVALTQRHFYDGLAFHRVVPDFVVQGGDPTSSGYGGPGFTTPAEPASGLESQGFVIGGIGIADAGRDSGGSQWFAMHSRAPHLDGRYTYIGAVRSGQKAADSLLIGDTIKSATVVVEP